MGDEVILRSKNWESFQHYKDRSPSWIKLHKSLLDNYEFACLPVASRALAPMIWLLASESTDGTISSTVRKLAFRLRMSDAELIDALKPLITEGFLECLQDASNVLAGCKRESSLEKRREETYKPETEEKAPANSPVFETSLNSPGRYREPFNATEMARIVCQQLSFLSRDNMQLMADVIQNVMTKQKVNAEQASQYVMDQWDAYRARFPAAKLRFFLSDGTVMQKESEWGAFGGLKTTTNSVASVGYNNEPDGWDSMTEEEKDVWRAAAARYHVRQGIPVPEHLQKYLPQQGAQ